MSQNSFTTVPLELNFQKRDYTEWKDLFSKVVRSNWMQTIAYANAVRLVDQRLTRFATVERGSEIIGIVAVQEQKLSFIHFITIQRGPLWFTGQDTNSNMTAFAQCLERLYPHRPFRRIRWMPEFHFSDISTIPWVEDKTFKPTHEKYETRWMDLTEDIESIKNKLHTKWRYSLKKSLSTELKIKVDFNGSNLDHFIKEYDFFKARKKFQGPSGKFMKQEILTAISEQDALLLWGYYFGVPVAGIFILKHGNSASYRIAWNSQTGRETMAHFQLLWKGIETLKEQGIKQLDLGGVISEDRSGLTFFKMGLHSEPMKTEMLK